MRFSCKEKLTDVYFKCPSACDSFLKCTLQNLFISVNHITRRLTDIQYDPNKSRLAATITQSRLYLEYILGHAFTMRQVITRGANILNQSGEFIIP